MTKMASIAFRRLLLMPWRWSRWTLGLILAAGFLITYGLSYAALADRAINMAAFRPDGTVDAAPSVYYPRTQVLPPELREAVQLLFVPAHRVDRLVRPRYWDHFSVIVILD